MEPIQWQQQEQVAPTISSERINRAVMTDSSPTTTCCSLAMLLDERQRSIRR